MKLSQLEILVENGQRTFWAQAAHFSQRVKTSQISKN